MNKLRVVDLYNDSTISDTFSTNTRSVLEVNKNYNKVEVDYEWLDLMEDTIKYLDNILRNPNRFIINEEEIVKIELARRVTVESVKHLAKHTNLIQEIEDDGSVKPSKILNINKDESYNTYENRLIYTLINNMIGFIQLKKKDANLFDSLKDEKRIQYHGVSRFGGEKVNIDVNLSSIYHQSDYNDQKGKDNVLDRIERLENHISVLTNSDVYRTLKRLHVSKVIPPIKKTNVILKNTNFQYAMRLWDYLQTHVASNNKVVKENKKYEDEGVLRAYFDEVFLLDYISLCTLNESKRKEDKKKKIEEITDNLIQKIIELNADMPLEDLKDTIGAKIAISKNKNKASLDEIQNTFLKHMNGYLDKINTFDIWSIK